MNQVQNKKPCREACKAVCRRELTVNLPVTVKPVVNLGKVRTRYAGCPAAICAENKPATGSKTCKFTVIQQIEVEIPLTVSVKAVKADAAEPLAECSDTLCLNISSCDDAVSESESNIR